MDRGRVSHVGRRSEWRSRGFDLRRLNTPPPIMSVNVTPPNYPDPFGCKDYPIMELGSGTWDIDVTEPRVQPRQFVVELTVEEDQAITNLLKLHHHQPSPGEENLRAAHDDDYDNDVEPHDLSGHYSSFHSDSAEGAYKPTSTDHVELLHEGWRKVEQETCRSTAELEAADVLASRFSLEEDHLPSRHYRIHTPGRPHNPTCTHKNI